MNYRRIIGDLFALRATITVTDCEIGYGTIAIFAIGVLWIAWDYVLR